jgi:hypothetical protein
MAAIRRSVYLDAELDNRINSIAKAHYDGNYSRALNYLIRKGGGEKEFVRFMAKHHASLFNHFSAVLAQFEASKPVVEKEHHDQTFPL